MRSFLLPLCASALLACTVQSSSADATSEPRPLKHSSELPIERISASHGAFSDGKKLEIFAAFLGDGFLLVGEGDSVNVDVNGNRVPVRERIEGDKVHYVAEVSPPPAQPEVVVTLVRGASKSSTKVDLARDFELRGVPASMRAGDVVSIDLEPRPDLPTDGAWRNAVEVRGECLQFESERFELSKDFPLAWDTASLHALPGSAPCTLDVQVRVESFGVSSDRDGGLNGLFEGLQHRSFRIALAR